MCMHRLGMVIMLEVGLMVWEFNCKQFPLYSMYSTRILLIGLCASNHVSLLVLSSTPTSEDVCSMINLYMVRGR